MWFSRVGTTTGRWGQALDGQPTLLALLLLVMGPLALPGMAQSGSVMPVTPRDRLAPPLGTPTPLAPPIESPTQAPTPSVTPPSTPEPLAPPVTPSTPAPVPPTSQPTPIPAPTATPVSPSNTSGKRPGATETSPAFLGNPLDLQLPDPLLPKDAGKRPLTSAERKQLTAALDALDAEALAKHKLGDRIGAFEIWHRELRLRRYLGPLDETRALGRVGDIAWQDNDSTEVQWITERLNAILAQANAPTLPGFGKNISLGQGQVLARFTLLDALGLAYQQVRLPQTAATVYQQLLTEARQRNNPVKVEETLTTLGQLYLAWFDYGNAGLQYQELLAIARKKGDPLAEVNHLKQLVFIYEQAKQFEEAVSYLQQLIKVHQAQNQPEPIPALQLKLGDDYQQLSRLDLAERHYQLAYQLAQPLLQFGYASDALQKLASLYRKNDRLDAALRVYTFLIGVEQQAYNYYGMMSAYDQLGQLYLTRKAYPQALAAFQQGLKIAKQLKFRENYFSEQIQQITKPATPKE